MFKYFVFFFLWTTTTAIYGQVDTSVRSGSVPPPPPSPPVLLGEEETFKVVEHMPRFPGCEHLLTEEEKRECSNQKLLEFFQKNIVYPAEAKQKRVRGTVIASWIVEKDGTVTSPTIIEDIGSGCGKEVLRVVHLMNEKGMRWIPGPSRGRPVRVSYKFPVKFTKEMMNRP